MRRKWARELPLALLAVLTALGVSVVAHAAPQAEATASSSRGTEEVSAQESVSDAVAEARRLLDAGRLLEAQAVMRPMIERVAELEGEAIALAGPVVAVLAEALHRSGSDLEPEDRPRLERLLELQEEALGPHHPALEQVLLELACLSYTVASSDEIERLYRRVVKIQLESPRIDRLAAARTLIFLAGVLNETGALGRAKQVTRQALEIAQQELGSVTELLERRQLEPRHGVLAEALSDFGTALYQTGDVAEARRLWQQAAVLTARSLGEDHPLDAAIEFNLAALKEREGRPHEALKALQGVLRVWSSRMGAQHFYVGVVQLRIGGLLQVLGRMDEARDHLLAARNTLETSLGVASYRTGAALNQLARLSWREGNTDEAFWLFEQARQRHASANFSEHPEAARNLDDLGRLLMSRGEGRQAFATALEAEAIGREAVRTGYQATGERQALYLDGRRPGGLDTALTALAEGSGDVARAWDEVIRSRAMVIDEIATRHRSTRDQADPEKRRRWHRLAEARQQLANLYVRHGAELSRDPRLAEAREKRDLAERKLAEVSEAFRGQERRRAAGFAEVRAELPADAALVAFVRYGHLDGTPDGPEPRRTSSYLALAWAPGMRSPVAVPLGSAAEIETSVSRVRDVLGSHSERRYLRVAAELRRQIWDPLEPLVGAAPRLVIVPDGALHQVQVAALPLANGRYWIERGQILQHLSAERDLIVPPPGGRPRARHSALLALGGAEFDSLEALGGGHTWTPVTAPSPPEVAPTRGPELACDAFHQVQYPPLAGSSREARQVADLHRSLLPEDSVIELSGVAASESAFKHWAPGSRNLHLATHGFSLAPDCRSTTAEGASPLLFSGLALAGANRRGRAGAGDEDGILTAEEIASLDLSSVDWAVLSACDTGLGEVIPGEGVLGLRRGFRIAGVHTLILSLWPVDDAVTRELMGALYRGRWQRSLDAAAAVHAASLEILQQRRRRGQSAHPYYWAPFIAEGR